MTGGADDGIDEEGLHEDGFDDDTPSGVATISCGGRLAAISVSIILP